MPPGHQTRLPTSTRTNHDRIPFPLLALSTLALTSTTTALTLSDFAPRAFHLSPFCERIYRAPISGCEPSDFAGGRPCTQMCIDALNRATDVVWNVCGGDSRNDEGIISAFLRGKGVEALCPNVNVDAGYGAASSGQDSEVPVPVPVPVAVPAHPPPDPETTPSDAHPAPSTESSDRPAQRTHDTPRSTHARQAHRSTSIATPTHSNPHHSTTPPHRTPRPEPTSTELPYKTVPESGSAVYPSSQTQEPSSTTAATETETADSGQGTRTQGESGVCGDGSLADQGGCWESKGNGGRVCGWSGVWVVGSLVGLVLMG